MMMLLSKREETTSSYLSNLIYKLKNSLKLKRRILIILNTDKSKDYFMINFLSDSDQNIQCDFTRSIIEKFVSLLVTWYRRCWSDEMMSASRSASWCLEEFCSTLSNRKLRRGKHRERNDAIWWLRSASCSTSWKQ